MVVRHLLGFATVLTVAGACALGCGSAPDQGLGSASLAVSGPKCNQVEVKDSLIADLVYHSVVAGYPLTRLSVAADGTITGPALPEVLAGDLEVINTVPEALASVTRALEKVSGLPDYVVTSVAFDSDACTAVPAWTPSGSTLINTDAYSVSVDETNQKSWKTAHREFSLECPLVKVNGEKDDIDPPGDGSTNDPPSITVSDTGIHANAYGICPVGTPVGTKCMLSYASGVNYVGRACQYYFGQLRCLLY